MIIWNYRKASIDRPEGYPIFFESTKIKAYYEKVLTFLSEYPFIVVLWQVICRKKSGDPWSIYRSFTVITNYYYYYYSVRLANFGLSVPMKKEIEPFSKKLGQVVLRTKF